MKTTANKASEIIGMEVRNEQNEKLGKVEKVSETEAPLVSTHPLCRRTPTG
jgi:hypothetical protein